MYSETVEPKGNKKKLFLRIVLVLFVVIVLLALINHFQFYPGILTMAVFLLAAIALFGEYRRNFIRYTYILNEDTLYIDRRVGSFDAILEQVKKSEIESFQKVDAVPEGKMRNYSGSDKRDIYMLSYEKGTFYFTPGRGLVSRLEE